MKSFEKWKPIQEIQIPARSSQTEDLAPVDCTYVQPIVKEKQPTVVHAYITQGSYGGYVKIEKGSFTMGKAIGQDYWIVDDSTVSREHACIERREDGFYLIDKDSKNHTYVNNQVITAPYKLEDGTRFRLSVRANFEFVLKEEVTDTETSTPKAFEGALLGLDSMKDQGYACTDKEEVFFYQDEELSFSPYKVEQPLVGIFYNKEKEEYCIEPYRNKAVFLPSGQPLGKGKQYHVPRGTIIYIETERSLFQLV